MKAKSLIWILALFLIALPIVNAATPDVRFFGRQNQNLTIVDYCYNSGSNCLSTVPCNITVTKDNFILKNKPMTNTGASLTYLFKNTSSIGQYQASVVCSVAGTSQFDNFFFKITSFGNDDSLYQTSNLMMVVIAIGLAIIFIMISNSLAPEHVFFKLILLFFSFGMMYLMGDAANKALQGTALETTSNMLFYTISWLYRIFVGYIIIYTMYASAKWLGWLNGLRGWFK